MNTVLKRVSAAIVTIAASSLPITALAVTDQSSGFRTEAWSVNRVLRTFMNVGGMTSTSFDNESIGDSGFDFPAMFSHPCYEPVGEHVQEACNRRFGMYGNLKIALRSTEMRNALTEKFGAGIIALLGVANEDVAEVEAEDAAQASADSDVIDSHGTLRDRSIQLWNICQQRFENNPAACFQDNMRLLGKTSISIVGNVNHHTTVSQ